MSLKIFEFSVTGEPVAKGRHRTTRSGHSYTPKKTKDYQDYVKLCFSAEYGNMFDSEKLEGPLFAILTYRMRKAKSNKKSLPYQKPDFDNLCKCTLDALNGWAYQDDCQIVMPIAPKIWHDTVGEEGFSSVVIGEFNSITPENIGDYQKLVMDAAMAPVRQLGIV